MVILILVAIFIAWLVIKPYTIKYDTMLGITGGLGSGKSFYSVVVALCLLHRARLRTLIYNIVHPSARLAKPDLYSNIPIRTGLRTYSKRLTSEILTLQERIIPGSVVLIDEVDGFANQFGWENPNVSKIVKHDKKSDTWRETPGLFDDFCRFFRHYYASSCVEPHIILNTQAMGNINLAIRRRMNTVYTLREFRTFRLPFISLFGISLGIYWLKATKNDLSDETVVNVYDESKERNVIGLLPFYRRYDTHCYSERIKSLPLTETDCFKRKKTNTIAKCPFIPLSDSQVNTDNFDD